MLRSGPVTLFGHAVLYTVCCVASACSVYDSTLIASKPQGVASQPTAGKAPAANSGRDAGDSDASETDASDHRDASTMPRVPIEEVHCGDGRITGAEKCDIGIPEGMPGSCPKDCPELAPCNPRKLNNAGGCQAECVVLQLVCKGGDGCCPGNCTDKNDSDCSSSCGDGVIQSDNGETCESETTMPCKMSDADCDDKEVCTVDKLVGSAKNCNAQCTNVKITTAKNDDGCCPPGADKTVDNDCAAICGNKITEPGEDCDGSTGCNAQCKFTQQQADMMACLAKFGEDDACAKCSCQKCATQYLACRASDDTKANDLCNAILVCAAKENCYGTQCYCGDALFCSLPNGGCQREIEVAAGSTDPQTISNRANDPMATLGKAYLADGCRYQQCPQQCRP